jgi:anti-anti-sigma factor
MGVAHHEGMARVGERVERPSGAAPSLRIALKAVGDDAQVIELVGELDLSTIPMVETRLMRTLRTHEALVLDLSRVVFIDSTGIALLIRAHRVADPGGKLRTVISRDSQVERVLSISGVDRILSVFFDRDQAIAAIAPQASAARTDAA